MKYKKFLIRLLQFYIALILVQISTQTIHSIEQSDYKNQTKVQSKSPLSLQSLKVSSLAASAAAATASSQSLKSNKNKQHDDLFPFANSHIRLATNFNTSIFTQSTSTARATAAGAPTTLSVTAPPSVSTSTSVSSSASAFSTPRSFTKKKIHSQHSSKSNITTRDTLSHKASEHEPVIFIPETRLPPIHHNNYVPSLKNNKNSIGFNSQKNSIDWKSNGSEAWDRQYRKVRYSNIKVQHIEAECQDDFMKIRVGFNGSFTGLLYSSGYAYDPDCMYINGTGRDYYEFYIQLNRCGTLGKNNHHEDNRKTPTKNYMWNTVTVQYNPLIEEEFDEHFKVTCEYGYDFWKTVSFPFLNVEVATGNPVVFTLNPPECYMEIRYGYGTSGARVANAVRVGDPLTLMIYMRSKFDGFDIAVNNCYAHNGATKRILLINEFGCPVDDTLMSRFRGSFSESGLFETQVYAYMKAFRFTGSPALYIECDVRMCHGRCPSQTCHWRNIKTVRKRSIDESDMDAVAESASTNSTNPVFLSENINLFQSLQVLQDGETDDELTPYDSKKATAAKSTSLPPNYGTNSSQTLASNLVMDPYSVCMKTGVFSAVLACVVGLICLLSGALITTCSRLKKTSKFEKSMFGSFDGYISHKNRIH